MVEAAEEMIGNIPCAGDLHMDAPEDPKDALVIHIIIFGGSGGPDSGSHFSASLGASGGSGGGTASRDTGAKNENLASSTVVRWF